ncbi:MAG: AmmeMemoRadiSam system protein B [Planctomycetota bacterium]|jgi:AmmeMemoRadiSam system protein A
MIRTSWLVIVTLVIVSSGACDEPPVRKVREAAVARLFYKDREQPLADQIDQLLSEAESVPIERLRALVCPHAGYEFSGPVAATAYKQLRGRDLDTVIVLAPSHYADFQGASIPAVDAYKTPLGLIRLSPRTDELVGKKPFARGVNCQVRRPGWWRQTRMTEVPPFGEDTPHTWEHSLEVQLPFLQKTLDDFKLVPIVFGRADSREAAEVLASVLDDRTLLVASSDLSHYHPYEVAGRLDASCVKAICELDVDWMVGQEACGKLPILTVMHMARKNGWQAKLLDYRNSGDTSDAPDAKSRVVGYAAIAFFEPEGGKAPSETKAPSDTKAGPLGPSDGEILLDLAARTVREVVTRGTDPGVDLAELPQGLGRWRACFVTLTKGGKLRGCIGSLFPQEPLGEAVVRKARGAATEDPRFPRVGKDELDELEIEVSVLTIPRRLEYNTPEELLDKLRPHTDGVVLQAGRQQATYLPQVWEKPPEPATFLSRLAQKAGLSADAWKDPEAIVLTYQVQAFGPRKMAQTDEP